VVNEAEQPKGVRITVNIVADDYEIVGDDTVWGIAQFSDVNGCALNATGPIFDPTGDVPAIGDLYQKIGGMMAVRRSPFFFDSNTRKWTKQCPISDSMVPILSLDARSLFKTTMDLVLPVVLSS
jgi:hypothetical protein